MPQRNIHRSNAATSRPATVDGLLWQRGMLLLALITLVLLISHGGAG